MNVNQKGETNESIFLYRILHRRRGDRKPVRGWTYAMTVLLQTIVVGATAYISANRTS